MFADIVRTRPVNEKTTQADKYMISPARAIADECTRMSTDSKCYGIGSCLAGNRHVQDRTQSEILKQMAMSRFNFRTQHSGTREMVDSRI